MRYVVEVTANEIVRKLLAKGAKKARQSGAHAFYVSACGKCRTTVSMHRGDVPTGTLRAIEKSMEPCYGKGWLLG